MLKYHGHNTDDTLDGEGVSNIVTAQMITMMITIFKIMQGQLKH